MSLHGLHGSLGPSNHYMVCNFIAYIKIDNGPKGDLHHLSGSFTNGFFRLEKLQFIAIFAKFIATMEDSAPAGCWAVHSMCCYLLGYCFGIADLQVSDCLENLMQKGRTGQMLLLPVCIGLLLFWRMQILQVLISAESAYM